MRVLARGAFWVYAAVLFTATHWPNLKIESSYVERPDIFIHAATFGLWTMLLIGTGYFAHVSGEVGRAEGVMRAAMEWAPRVLTTRGVLISGAVGLGYAAFDEATQAIPGLGRTAAIDDFGADAVGVMAAVVAGLIAQRVVRSLSKRAG